MIFEDDFYFVISKEELEEQLERLFTEKPDFDVVMLSYLAEKMEPCETHDFLQKTISAQTASGYIVNEKMYDKMIELYEHAAPLLESTREHWNYANDQIWKKLQPTNEWYCFTKRCGKQHDDIVTIVKHSDRMIVNDFLAFYFLDLTLWWQNFIVHDNATIFRFQNITYEPINAHKHIFLAITNNQTTSVRKIIKLISVYFLFLSNSHIFMVRSDSAICRFVLRMTHRGYNKTSISHRDNCMVHRMFLCYIHFSELCITYRD